MTWGESSEEKEAQPVVWLAYEECLLLGVNPLGRSDLRSKLTRYKAYAAGEWELRRVWAQDDVKALAARLP